MDTETKSAVERLRGDLADARAEERDVARVYVNDLCRVLDALAAPPPSGEETTWEVTMAGNPHHVFGAFSSLDKALNWAKRVQASCPIYRVTRRLVEGGGE